MLPDLTLPLPASLMALLGAFQPLFAAPSFRTFCALSAGFLAQTGRHTVCGLRTGPKVHAIGWFHDGSAKGPHQVGLGNNWVIAAITVTLPFLSRPVALPALARLVHKDIKPAPASRLVLARYELAPPRTGRRGRPRAKGKRLPSLAALAGTASFAPVTVRRYGKTVI